MAGVSIGIVIGMVTASIVIETASSATKAEMSAMAKVVTRSGRPGNVRRGAADAYMETT